MSVSIRSFAVVCLAATLGTLMIVGYARIRAGGAAPVSMPADRDPVELAQPVTGALVVRGSVSVTVAAVGRAAAHRTAVMRAPVGSRVRRLWVRENVRVADGDPLVLLDTTALALAAARARAELRRAEAAFRELVLFDGEIADPAVRKTREQVARARSGLDQADLALLEAEFDLERTVVRAPFAGRAARVQVTEGGDVSPGDELVTVVDLDSIRVEARVLETDLGWLEEGRGASVSFTGIPGEVFRGRVETISPVVDPGTGTSRVRVSLANPGGRIRPGMHARLALEARTSVNRVLVPRDAILERDHRTVLFVFEAGEEDASRGRSAWREVTTGVENRTVVEIAPDPETDGVAPGEIVLVEGHHHLVHGAAVRLVGDPGSARAWPDG
ncbi:MAG: efflux RND transporter periplasmic adaptor subunit [Gemmatimonadetes bacterium]|nr:efflux RND transporter periplasmic adaptor subunit [Gemmatimonadota bacterium]NIR80642.1 efflux RND transporter periplasmic adaptor subunit [Gemmatimonadota bacterium]NIT89429.1 efflux RND transporter periplasmic adaptor subunit [Gemmatimonadota bacterium]NIU33236.1 efflux RND transporter periplasmic adaptor subunit [Gemmatimonadota bacterium]NIU37549.1 efflux RND transporter periplasmic adaptor subunit [Gemmatimonadota bacterium]